MARPDCVIALDNGAGTIKAGVIGRDAAPRLVPNCVTKTKGGRGLLGILTDWDVERLVWERVFSPEGLGCEPGHSWLMLTEPCLNLPNVQDAYDQVVFEEFGFDGYSRLTAPHWTVANDLGPLFGEPAGTARDCVLVLDTGYSFTHAVPFLRGRALLGAIRRLGVGGKLLTNHLKEMISFRQWNMMDETYLVNQVKEACCYVAQDVYADLEICRGAPRANTVIQAYVLPDFSKRMQGYVRTIRQVLWMNNERFTVPEVLFYPSDLGMPQAGVAELILQAVQATPEALHPLLYANIVLTGGNARLPGFRSRLLAELRRLVPAEYPVRIGLPDDPVAFAWHGAGCLAAGAHPSQLALDALVTTRADYQEYGTHACRRVFGALSA
ncbi:actin family [Thamnocephalis sphaerospora]|uniref:Actin-like protein ARP6 n=1 Tax=Thamnocephalis sphaerospora TaxID=78915 RepID=A0A4P9XP69_9FUNG|nr:actin family [Thamnocephalis sphaerospora]RKP07768.1 actin family [Thamnocephalis sphaerospora]|eukprot:RKP05678.1 actin family [Thamnocephalis sphaerospora]